MTAPLSIITVVLRLPEPARGVLVRAKAIVLHDMFLDLGTASREETEELGVRVGVRLLR